RLRPLRQARAERRRHLRRGAGRGAVVAGRHRDGALRSAARLPRRARARRPRRLQLRGRGPDPRHPGRHGDVEAAPGTPHPEAGAGRVDPGGGDMKDPCAHCEEMMQPYLDHVLTDEEMRAAEAHLAECVDCIRGYKFEESLRIYVRKATTEPMPVELKQKLAALRIP